jgi:hypothetical protein
VQRMRLKYGVVDDKAGPQATKVLLTQPRTQAL